MRCRNVNRDVLTTQLWIRETGHGGADWDWLVSFVRRKLARKLRPMYEKKHVCCWKDHDDRLR